MSTIKRLTERMMGAGWIFDTEWEKLQDGTFLSKAHKDGNLYKLIAKYECTEFIVDKYMSTGVTIIRLM